MKFKTVCLLTILCCLVIAGCSSKQADTAPRNAANEVIYYAKGENWLATYSLFKVNKSIFESIYIQYIGEDRHIKAGPIEYELLGSDYEASSSFPQELQGVGSFQVSTEFNADLFTLKPASDDSYKLTIKSKLDTETLSLTELTAK